MKLAELQVRSFVDLLSSDAPAPGGGSTAALEGALGAALVAMVCKLTTVGKSREKYAAFQKEVLAAQQCAARLYERFVDVMDRDTDAFNIVSAAYGMPKGSDAEKAARSEAIQKGLERCTETPLEMMTLACEALELSDGLIGKTNESAASDFGVSALSLRAAIQGAWLNVRINIGSLKDKERAAEFAHKGEELLAKALPLADKIYTTVLAQL